ncbi:MAG: gliding motility protein GldN, partial [Flavobacteriaceae bacterium]|nr:gliding motility protein GldN [Flavobacteriaceae bacterium]
LTNESVEDPEKEYTPMFWVFYPETREVLSKAYAFNRKNMSKPLSFDHLINSRRFSGTIFKEANVYQDRDIRDYISKNALMQLLESDRIKEKIRNREQDMWSY